MNPYPKILIGGLAFEAPSAPTAVTPVTVAATHATTTAAQTVTRLLRNLIVSSLVPPARGAIKPSSSRPPADAFAHDSAVSAGTCPPGSTAAPGRRQTSPVRSRKPALHNSSRTAPVLSPRR